MREVGGIASNVLGVDESMSFDKYKLGYNQKSSQKSKMVDCNTVGAGFAECNRAFVLIVPVLEGQGHTEMEQFAEISVLWIWRLTNGAGRMGHFGHLGLGCGCFV